MSLTRPAPRHVNDRASLIAWFTADHIVRNDGSIGEREPSMTMEEARLLAAKIDTPSYFNYRPDSRPLWSAASIWHTALERGLFNGGKYGWIDRNGRFWTCGYASHDLLLHFLGMEPATPEKGGWIRISTVIQNSGYVPSEPQHLKLIEMGYARQAADFMIEGIEPRRDYVKAARVTIPEPMEGDPQ